MPNIMQTIMQMMSMGRNPQEIIQNMAMRNPQVNQIISQMKNSGMSNEQYARQLAKQNNIDINQIMMFLNNMGIR